MKTVVFVPIGAEVRESAGVTVARTETVYSWEDMPSTITGISLPKEDFATAVKAIAYINKIRAIQMVRAAFNRPDFGLKAAKDFVEAIM